MNLWALLVGSYLTFAAPKEPTQVQLDEWQAYKLQYGKSYETGFVDEMRRSIYLERKQYVDSFNSDASANRTFVLSLNHLSDLSDAQMAAMNGYRAPADFRPQHDADGEKYLQSILARDVPVPDELDWRKVQGRVSRVKNQGKCGSCWAFATVGMLEGQEAVQEVANLSQKGLIELSEQNLVDCTQFGCMGGWVAGALDFIAYAEGIDDETTYPYEGFENYCRFIPDKVVMTDAGHIILPKGDEQRLKEVVAKFGPVAVAVDADNVAFWHYKSGVYHSDSCSTSALTHAMLVVGYGTDKIGGDYWLLKNSYTEQWGDNGYIRMARNRNNMCGITTAATVAKF